MLDFRGLIEKALVALESNRPADAEKAIRSALSMSPRDDQLLHLLGVSLIHQLREAEAIEPLQRAISLNRRDAEYHNALGCALRNVGRLSEGLESFERALRLAPGLTDAHYNLASTFQRLGEFGQAEERFRQILARNPQDVEVHGALAKLRWFIRDFEGAVDCLRRSIAAVPTSGDLRFLLGEQLLALGRFEEGWWHYLWRVNRSVFFRRMGLPFNAPEAVVPLAKSLAGRAVKVHAEQGIGDDFFFLRFVEALRSRGARVEGWVTPRLIDIISRSGCLDVCHPASERLPPAPDYLLLGDLPHLLGAPSDPVPPSIRFEPGSAALAEVSARLGNLPRPLTGLTWRAGTGPEAGNRNALYKEIPFDQFVEAASKIPGSLLVLQRSPRQEELDRLQSACGGRVHDFSSLNADLERMLALLRLVDDYLGVSNTNMHLCAGLGRPADVLVSGSVEFRWMAEGTRSPWFPDFRIHRQQANGDWAAALGEAVSALRAKE